MSKYLHRLKDILCSIKDVALLRIESYDSLISLRKALENAYRATKADLSGYIALSDSILYLIMHSQLKGTGDLNDISVENVSSHYVCVW